jgi:hypothetical protein
MRRSTSHLIVIAGFALAAVLLAAGGLLIWGSTYTHNMVHDQLAAQQIYFPPKTAFAHPDGKEITSGMIPSVSQYAGQQLVTGQQAQSYADNFIAVHIKGMTGGQTYAQLSAQSLAHPEDTKLAGMVAAVFKGETLRGILLNAFGWWKVSQITYIASLISFGLGGLVLLGSLAGLTLGRRPEITHEAIPAAGGQAPATAA